MAKLVTTVVTMLVLVVGMAVVACTKPHCLGLDSGALLGRGPVTASN